MAQTKASTVTHNYGAARSIQLISGAKSGVVAMGMAALVSADGYALTAGHVIEDLPVSILRPKGPKTQPSDSIGELRNNSAFVGKTGNAKREALQADKTQPNQKLVRTPARVVRRFRDVDLALVKLPVTTTRWFPLTQNIPDALGSLYITTNPVNHGGPTTLEGQVQAPEKVNSRGTPAWWVDSNIPIVPGDSGSPAFDDHGNLIGCVALGNVWRFVSSKTRSSGDRWTSIMGVNSTEIQRSIQVDRQRLAQNMKKLHADPTLQASFDDLIPKALPKHTEGIPVSGMTEVQLMERLMEAKDRQKGFFW